MKTNKSIILAILIAAGWLTLGFGTRALAQTASPITLLQSAHATLAGADHDYNGHRVAAMWQIEAAIRELEGVKATHHVKLQYGHHAGKHAKNREPQATSDAQLRTAEGLVQQAAAGLSGKPLRHLKTALAQLNTALSIK